MKKEKILIQILSAIKVRTQFFLWKMTIFFCSNGQFRCIYVYKDKGKSINQDHIERRSHFSDKSIKL